MVTGQRCASPGKDELLSYILGFRPRHQECREYYINHMERVMMRLQYIGNMERSSKILEIGAPPFNTTLVLRRLGFTNITCTNYVEDIGNRRQEISSEAMKIYSPERDEWQSFDVSTFDVEIDPWPYEDGSFDAVFGFEILEHLARDPLHMLSEANRVTKSGGLIFLTTPNVASMHNIFNLLRFDSPGECPYFRPAKAQGARHNREWSPVEVKAALGAAGYEILRLETRQLGSPPPLRDWIAYISDAIARLAAWRRHHIFALARKISGVRERFPTESNLYYHFDREANLGLEARKAGEKKPPDSL